MTDTTIPNNALGNDEDRFNIVLEAAYEIEQLSNVLRRESKGIPDGMEYLFRGLAMRIKELSTVVMSGLADEAEKTTELAFWLRGEKEDSHA